MQMQEEKQKVQSELAALRAIFQWTILLIYFH